MSAEELAFALIELVIKLIGIEQTSAILSQKQIDEANATADAIEDAKFGPKG